MENPQNILKFINPNNIHFDSKNPRGESEEEIVNDNDFKRLRKSIREVGVIVPIIVRPKVDLNDNYYLIDGERRLRAATAENIELVPIRIVKDEIDGRILAYQIHMHRKDWTRNAEAKAIISIIEEEINIDPDSENEEELKRKLIEITNHTNKEIQDFLNLFKYEKDVIDLVINFPKKYHISYIDQIEASFISPLKRNYPNLFNKYGEKEIRKILGYKFINKLFVKSRYLMDTFNVVFQNENNRLEIETILDSFLTDINKSITTSFTEFQSIGKNKNEEKPKVVNIIEEENKIDKNKKDNYEKVDSKDKIATLNNENKTELENFTYSPIRLNKKQQTLIDDIKPKFESIGNTFTIEEKEYIKEAIYCLKNHCFKASVLMIWSTGISRILSFIEKDIPDFNKCSKEIKQNPSLFTNKVTDKFKTDYQKIESIRNDARDVQLLCYLCHKNIIDFINFEKLQSNYKTRCNCAHPTSITLEINETIAIFENLYNLILNNPNLK